MNRRPASRTAYDLLNLGVPMLSVEVIRLRRAARDDAAGPLEPLPSWANEPEPDGSFAVEWDNKPMRGFRRGRHVLAYTTTGEPAVLVMFADWPEGQETGSAAGLLGPDRLKVWTIARARAMAQAWYAGGKADLS